jgi:hypothetical protein
MKFIKTILGVICLVYLQACKPEYDNSSETYLDKVMPYVAKLPDALSGLDKHDSLVQAYYKTAKTERQYKWKYHAIKPDSTHFFFITRLEPSIKHDKYAGISGKFRLDSNGNFSYYQEFFYTWKMKADSLEVKGKELFETVLQDKSLLPYLPGKSKGEWIMFPDANTYYDIDDRCWKTKP